MKKDYINNLLKFIEKNPTAFHVVDTVKKTLIDNGYSYLNEYENWKIEKAGKYFTTRNGSSLIAFEIGKNYKSGYNILAAHTDSPVFKIKEVSELHSKAYTRINTEGYGGMILSSWLDKPLSIAGRVIINEDGILKSVLVNIDRDLMLIPSVAIHMSRDAEKKDGLNKQVDLMPLFTGESKEGCFREFLAKEMQISSEEISGMDLYLYNRQTGSIWGKDKEFISSRCLDDQQCVYAGLEALISSKNDEKINVLAIFDNEETGSSTKQGADSTFLEDVLKRVNTSLGNSEEDYIIAVANSFMLSADNAHAVHPNHTELTDANNCVYMNEGVVLKFNAAQKYTTDAISAAVVKELAKKAGVPLQCFANRSDKAGGSTLGNISASHISVKCADVGLAQLSMHSSYETAGVKDTEYMIELIKCMFESSVFATEESSVYIR